MPDDSIPDPFVGPDSPPLDDWSSIFDLVRSLRELQDYGAFQMMTRRAYRERPTDDPFDVSGYWPGLQRRLWKAPPRELTRWSRHPHPAPRRILAGHECCPARLLDVLATDDWPEVRQAALGNNSLRPSRRKARAQNESVDWLREAAARPEPEVHGRCVRCGDPVKRLDRFLTCTIRCSIAQAMERIEDGTYMHCGNLAPEPHPGLRGQHGGWWPRGFSWEVAFHPAPGGIPGTGPRYTDVLISFVPGIGAVALYRSIGDFVERQDLTADEAVSVIQRLARSMDGPSVLEACAS
jgi:hypothetical protein